MTAATRNLSIEVVRDFCLECSADCPKAVTWCAATHCGLWPYRLGMQPKTVIAKYGDRLMNPEKMPGPSVDFDLLPAPRMEASTAEINVFG